MRPILCIFLLLITTSIEARMYQWVNPTTGRSQLSGKAPSWYRSETGGPRVLVFEKNVMVDDTAVLVSEDQRVQLRSTALPDQAKKEAELTQAEAVAKLEEQIQAIVESPAMEEYLKSPETKLTDNVEKTVAKDLTKADLESTEESADERVERLKALISAWDENKTEKAKSLVESKKVPAEKTAEK